MNHVLHTLFVLLATAALGAQQQATTLWHLADRAAVVVVAEATAATDPTPEWHRIEFRADEVLNGSLGTRFSLLEPAGRCCGHALFSVVPGQSYLLFLERRGSLLHPFAGDRGVLTADQATIEHVRSLLRLSTDAQGVARELAAALTAADSRIAHDAALALPSLIELPQDGTSRASIRSALRRHALDPTTALPFLAAAVVRMEPEAAAAELLPLYLETPTDDAARALQLAMADVAVADLATAMLSRTFANDSERVRAASLLERRPDAANLPVLNRMLTSTPKPRVALAVTEALLAHGLRPEDLRSRVPAVVLDLAVQRRRERSDLRVLQPGAPR